MHRLRFEKLWLTLGFGFVALVFYLSLAHIYRIPVCPME